MRGAAIMLAGGLAAGCSSSATRFDHGLDGLFTASTKNQRSIISPPASQPYPGDQVAATSPARSAVEPVAVSSVQRSSLPPANGAGMSSSSPAPAIASAQSQRPALAPALAPAPDQQHSARGSMLDDTVTGGVPPVQQAAMRPDAPAQPAAAHQGWGGQGTEVTIREGETLYNLSRRFGVPVDAIMRANNLANANSIAAGQKIVIPSYAYSNSAPISAPDANPDVAAAKSSRGTKFDVPSDRVPTPGRAPEKNLAVLPQGPKTDERDAGQGATAAPRNAAAPAADPNSYTVVAGDSLYAVARKTGSTTQAIMQANNLSSPVLRIGQRLVIPAGAQAQPATQVAAAQPKQADPVTTGATQSRPTAASAEARPGAEPAAYTPPRRADAVIEEAEQTAAVAPGATGIGKMRWPVRGRVISGFGAGSGSAGNDGIDIAVPEGTPVRAAENGVVIYAGNGLKEFGNTVLVRHEDGLVTVYGHNGELNVNRGDKVRRGQEIARSGMSGATDTPKLHFEVRKNSAPVDPSKYLE